MLLLYGKLVWLPLALVGPSGSSPPFLGAASYLPLRGDRVLYCWDPLRTACALREAGAGGFGSPAYYLVLELSTPVWALVGLVAVLSLAFSAYVLAGGSLRVLAAAGLALIALNSMAVGSLYVDQGLIEYARPRVEVTRVYLDPVPGVFRVELSLEGFTMESASCRIEELGSLETRVSGSAVEALVPRDYFTWLYSVRSAQRPFLPSPPAAVYEAFRVSCSIELDKGRIEGAYVASFAWREPEISASGSVVAIGNGNPVALEVSVFVVDKARLTTAWRGSKTLEPGEVWTLDLSTLVSRGVYDVRVQYTFLGSERVRGVEVSVG